MNYRHAYHAGNFSDVVKHAALALILEHLKAKESPFAVLDVFAGIGLYDLQGLEAQKTQEAARGVARIWPPPQGRDPRGRDPTGRDPLAPLLRPYLATVQALNTGTALRFYPGSPEVARRALRPQDRLVLAELHPDDARTLRRLYGGDPQVALHQRDGYEALPALVPPPERRGLVLIDPPYEQRDETQRLARSLARAYRRWPTGIYVVWYPIKEREPAEALLAALREAVPRKLLAAELTVFAAERAFRLNGCGLAVVNPPWKLDEQLTELLARLQPLLAWDGGRSRVEWLAGEAAAPERSL